MRRPENHLFQGTNQQSPASGPYILLTILFHRGPMQTNPP